MENTIEKKNQQVEFTPQKIRQQILDFEDIIAQQEGAFFGDSDNCPLFHSFADGIYVREIFIPAGSVITGKIHKHAHPNFLLSGTVDVVTEHEGTQRLIGPMSMISKAGTKRALHCLTDCWWATIHANPTNTQDLQELEKIVIAKDYEEYEQFIQLKENKIVKFITKMDQQITNCGLIALRNITSMKDISVRTLINLAEDNEIKLYPYSVGCSELDLIELPAIFHKENHFVFVDNKEDLKDFKNNSCIVLLTKEANLLPLINPEKIKGATWVAAGVASAAATAKIVQGIKQKRAAKDLKPSEYVPPGLLQNQKTAELQSNATSYPGQEADKAELDRNVANSIGFATRNLKSGSDILNLASAAETKRNNAVMDMSKRFQMFKLQSLNRLMGANAQVGNYEGNNYQQFLKTKQALLAAGDQNIYGGISGGGAAVASGFGGTKNNSSSAGGDI